MIVQKLVKSLYLALISNCCQLYDHEYHLMSDEILIVTVQMTCTSKHAQENGRDGPLALRFLRLRKLSDDCSRSRKVERLSKFYHLPVVGS